MTDKCECCVWHDVKEKLPELMTTILVCAKEGSYWPEVHGKVDLRPTQMYVGYFYDYHSDFKNLKPKIKFKIECGCSGYEFDEADLEVSHWMPLPKAPKGE